MSGYGGSGAHSAPTSTVTLYYHTACKGFTGRMFSPLCILEAAGVNYECKDQGEVPADADVFACPFVTLPSGVTLSQTTAICVALGQEYNLAPTNHTQMQKALQYTCDVADMMTDCAGKKGKERVMKWVNHFETVLGDKPFMLGDKVSFVDYTAMGSFSIFPGKAEKKSPDFEGVEMTPKVKVWFDKMMGDPAVKKVVSMAAFLPDSMY